MQADAAGVRFELRLESTGDEGAHYRVSLQQGEQLTEGNARIAADGAVSFEFAEAPPDWCQQQLRAALRTLHRDAGSRGSYPRRLTRWRPAPDTEARGSRE